MRKISFIITSYNIAPFIGNSLESVARVALPGDQVIIIDDGSDDGTDGLIRAHIETGIFADGVALKLLFLGVNTFGGVGISANIGLSEAKNETVFFVDGDDWINETGFKQARKHWNNKDLDILLTNYKVFNQELSTYEAPADQWLWKKLLTSKEFASAPESALEFIAVPWRKFYRKDLIEEKKIRFPEGDFFFEDNPFHWDVCLNANSIGFIDRVTCYHRVNRTGQTMASSGTELAAFFEHFETIMSKHASGKENVQLLAVRWLLNNMSWHLRRISDAAFYKYAKEANRVLQLVDDTVWSDAEESNASWYVANDLREGRIRELIVDRKQNKILQQLQDIERKLEGFENNFDKLSGRIEGQQAALMFASIKRQFND